MGLFEMNKIRYIKITINKIILFGKIYFIIYILIVFQQLLDTIQDMSNID